MSCGPLIGSIGLTRCSTAEWGALDLIVPQEQNLPDCDIVEVNAQLNDGLKTCRSVVSNYKALLTTDLKNAEVSPGAKSDEARARRQDTGGPNSDA